MKGYNNVKKTIGWADYTWNPVKGICPVGCWYCYARKFYQRFKLNSNIRLDLKTLHADPPEDAKRIFLGSTIDLFAQDCLRFWPELLKKITMHRNITYLVLTKLPHAATILDCFSVPSNLWLGVSVENNDFVHRIETLINLSKPVHKFVSFEPLLGFIKNMKYANKLDWIIIGGMKPKRHLISMIDSIFANATINMPIYVKTNAVWRQEFKDFP